MKKLLDPFLIAEIGINHNGSIKNVKKLIDISKKAGFDAVKFQKRNPLISTPEKYKEVLRETPWGILKYIDYKKKIELNRKDYDEINNYCKKKKIHWFASAWDLESLEFLDKYKLKYNKIASAMLGNKSLVLEIAKKKKYTFISTGGANFKDIEKVVKIFKKYKCQFSLMHSVSIYPCKEEMLNLQMIEILKKKFKCNVGYSGHESSVTPSIIAAALGADSIERHITLDRTMWGTDQAASLGPDGMTQLAGLVKKVKKIIGNGKKKYLDIEKKKISSMVYWKK